MMNDKFNGLGFGPADILLPRDCDLSRWSVVACDQYTSQPDYWQRVEEAVGDCPSTLRLILPESRLNAPDVEERISAINATMEHYLNENRFTCYPQSLIYVERTLQNGAIRRGLVGKIDLEQYRFEPGNSALIRATEGTVLSRIPPRVRVRQNAPIELPHVMLLADDPDKTVLEPLAGQVEGMKPLYDFPLMEGGGSLRGWLLTEAQQEQVALALGALADPERFNGRYHTENLPVMLFAVGDGNHSLATAKECYEQQKKQTPPEQWADLPSRYALCELCNLHDDSLEFEPIHRVLFGVEPEDLLTKLARYYPDAYCTDAPLDPVGHVLTSVRQGMEETVVVPNPTAQLPVGTLQKFLDAYLADHPQSRIDYIHGRDVAVRLADQPNAIAFLLPAMGKEALFPTVIHDGVLPRKTFSMGEAHDKRFYLEARIIQKSTGEER